MDQARLKNKEIQAQSDPNPNIIFMDCNGLERKILCELNQVQQNSIHPFH